MVDPVPVTDRAESPARRAGLPCVVGARRGGLSVAGMLAFIGMLFAWQASLLDLGGIGLPGPGFFPLVLALLLVIFSIVIGIGCRRASPADEPVEFGHPHVLIVLAALLSVPLAFEPLGGYITLGLLVILLLVFIARVSLLLAVLSSVVGMAACWYLFEMLLGVRLPTGPF